MAGGRWGLGEGQEAREAVGGYLARLVVVAITAPAGSSSAGGSSTCWSAGGPSGDLLASTLGWGVSVNCRSAGSAGLSQSIPGAFTVSWSGRPALGAGATRWGKPGTLRAARGRLDGEEREEARVVVEQAGDWGVEWARPVAAPVPAAA